MRCEGVGGTRHALERERDALLRTRLADTVVHRPGRVRAAELCRHVLGPLHALGGKAGIELEWVPADAHFVGVEPGKGALDAPLANVAPRADGVGNDVDLDHGEAQ